MAMQNRVILCLWYFTCLIVYFFGRDISEVYCQDSVSENETLESKEEVNRRTVEIVKLHNFTAINHYFTTSDGYILNLVQCKNPLVNTTTRGVVYFIHGTATNANFYVANSVGAHPIDHSQLDINSLSEDQLKEFFKDDPNKKSLPFLLLNVNYEVWLLNRRGTYQSQGHVGPNTQPYSNVFANIYETLFGGLPLFFQRQQQQQTRQNMRAGNPFLNAILSPVQFIIDIFGGSNTINPRYWNYTFDQQINIDLPETIDFILKTTNRAKLAVVGHSNGGLITLAGLSAIPELNEKISTALLWAPALYANAIRDRLIFASSYAILRSYIGPLIPRRLVPPIHDLLAFVCSTSIAQATICAGFSDLVFGYGAQQQVLIPGTVNALFDTYASQQILHYAQTNIRGKTYHFNYDSAQRNMIAYNQTEPPLYNVTKITNTRLTFWVGNHDGLVPLRDVQRIVDDLSVKAAKLVYIDQDGVYFNHISFALHQDVGDLLNIPSLKALASLASG